MYADASMHNPDGRWQMIFGINTIPERRNRGIASQLIRFCLVERVDLVLRRGDIIQHPFGFIELVEFVDKHSCPPAGAVFHIILWSENPALHDI